MSGRHLILLSVPLALAFLLFAASPPWGYAEWVTENQPAFAMKEDRSSFLPTRQKIEKGVFLVADARLTDPNFSKTVVLITQHGSTGSMGVVMKRPTRTPLSRVFPNIKEFEKRPEMLFIGGPVQREVMIYLFRTDTPPTSAIPIFEKVYFAPIIDTLTELLARSRPNDRFRIYAGYAGWAPGQLQGEIDRGDWRIVPGNADLLFQEETDSIWDELFRRTSQQSVELQKKGDPLL